jgi:hypothetical protein
VEADAELAESLDEGVAVVAECVVDAGEPSLALGRVRLIWSTRRPSGD